MRVIKTSLAHHDDARALLPAPPGGATCRAPASAQRSTPQYGRCSARLPDPARLKCVNALVIVVVCLALGSVS